MTARIGKLIVGLGNPGPRYRETRHNAGYMAVDALARKIGTDAWSMKCRSRIARGRIGSEKVLLAKPLTYMNLSGEAVRLLVAEYGLDSEDVVVVYDDLNLPLGKVRIRERGSAGGHRGMESILGALDGRTFVRVRLGIGEENMPEDRTGFVLAEFPPDRRAEVSTMIARGIEAVEAIVRDGISRAMSEFNA